MIILILRLFRKSKTMLFVNIIPYFLTLMLFISVFFFDNSYFAFLLTNVVEHGDEDLIMSGVLNQTQPLNMTQLALNSNQQAIVDRRIDSMIVFPLESYNNWFGFITENGTYWLKHNNITILVANELFLAHYYNISNNNLPILVSNALLEYISLQSNNSVYSVDQFSQIAFFSSFYYNADLYYFVLNFTESFHSFTLIPSPILDIFSYFSKTKSFNISNRLMILPLKIWTAFFNITWVNYYNNSLTLESYLPFKQILNSFYHFNRTSLGTTRNFNLLQIKINQLENEWYNEILLRQEQYFNYSRQFNTYFTNELSRLVSVAQENYKRFFVTILLFSLPLMIFSYYYTTKGFEWLASAEISYVYNLLMTRGSKEKRIYYALIKLIAILDLFASILATGSALLCCSFFISISNIRIVTIASYTASLTIFFFVMQVKVINRTILETRKSKNQYEKQEMLKLLKHRYTSKIIENVILALITAIVILLLVIINRFFVISEIIIGVTFLIILVGWWIKLLIMSTATYPKFISKLLRPFVKTLFLFQLTFKNISFVVRRKMDNHNVLFLILITFYLSASIFSSYEIHTEQGEAMNVLGDLIVTIENNDITVFNEIISDPGVIDYLPILEYNDMLLLDNADFFATNLSKLTSFLPFKIKNLDVISFIQLPKIKRFSNTNKIIISAEFRAEESISFNEKIVLIREKENAETRYQYLSIGLQMRKMPFFSNISSKWMIGDISDDMIYDKNKKLRVALKITNNENITAFVQYLQSTTFGDQIEIKYADPTKTLDYSGKQIQNYLDLALMVEGTILFMYVLSIGLIWRSNMKTWKNIALVRGAKRNTIKWQILLIFSFYLLLIIAISLFFVWFGVEIFLFIMNTMTTTWFISTNLPLTLNLCILCGFVCAPLVNLLEKPKLNKKLPKKLVN